MVEEAIFQVKDYQYIEHMDGGGLGGLELGTCGPSDVDKRPALLCSLSFRTLIILRYVKTK